MGFAALRVPAWGIVAFAGFPINNIVPYVGENLGLILTVAFTLADGGGMWRAAGAIGVFASAQIIKGYVLMSRIIGTRLRLRLMAVFLWQLIGGNLFGPLGLVFISLSC